MGGESCDSPLNSLVGGESGGQSLKLPSCCLGRFGELRIGDQVSVVRRVSVIMRRLEMSPRGWIYRDGEISRTEEHRFGILERYKLVSGK